MKKKGFYSFETRERTLTALDRNRGNVFRTAKQMGVSRDTVVRWAQEAKPSANEVEREADGEGDGERKPMDEQLEALAQYMVETMPEKVKTASLQELARVLPVVLSTLKEVRSRKERRSNVHEKLARLLDHYAAERETTEAVGEAE